MEESGQFEGAGFRDSVQEIQELKELRAMCREQLSTVAEQWLAAGRPDMAIEIWIQTDSLTKQAARIRSIIEDFSSKSPVSDEAEFSAYTTACLKLL